MKIEQVLDRGALRAEPDQNPVDYKKLTLWEKQVLANPDRYRDAKDFWGSKTRTDFVARWGGLPLSSQPVQAAADKMAASRRR